MILLNKIQQKTLSPVIHIHSPNNFVKCAFNKLNSKFLRKLLVCLSNQFYKTMSMNQLLPLQITNESENFIAYFNAVNPLFLKPNVKSIRFAHTDTKTYLKVSTEKELYLNKVTYLVEYINLEKVVSDCDCDQNPEGFLFIPLRTDEDMIDDFVNIGDDCLIEIFEVEHINELFVQQHFELEVI